MILFVINGNTSQSVSAGIERASQETAFEGTEIRMITPETGPSTIEGYLDGQLSATAVCEQIAKYHDEADAFVIACFSDPGLYASREITKKPVVGIAEASMITALQLGHQFSLLTPLRRLIPLLRGVINQYGLLSRLASIRHVDISVAEAAQGKAEHMNAFMSAGMKAIEEDGAEVLVLAGAVLAGLEKAMSAELDVPVLDPVKCAVAQAQILVRLGLKTSHIGGFSTPNQKECLNCPDSIKKLYELD